MAMLLLVYMQPKRIETFLFSSCVSRYILYSFVCHCTKTFIWQMLNSSFFFFHYAAEVGFSAGVGGERFLMSRDRTPKRTVRVGVGVSCDIWHQRAVLFFFYPLRSCNI